MKTNHRRKQPKGSGYDYSYLNFVARVRAGVGEIGLGMDHDGGHRGSAKDIKDVKTHRRRKRRRVENREPLVYTD